MNFTVTGYGFNTGAIVAKVDGQDCIVTSSFEYSFSCKVEAKSEVSISDASYLGSYGLRRNYLNESGSYLRYSNLDSYTPYTKTLALSMEAPAYEGDRIGNIWKGWFVAPATTNYKFYIACDDYCNINLGNISG